MKDLLYPLILLACPISMTLMMWFMMRGKHTSAPETDAEVARLRADLDQLRASQPAADTHDKSPADRSVSH